jgi:putative phosphoesterase
MLEDSHGHLFISQRFIGVGRVKIGIISDIHAVPEALRKTLEDMPAVDRLLCAGDAISEYRFCAETVQLLQQARAECIQGNHEHVLFNGANPRYLRHCQTEFAPELLAVLATAPMSLEFTAAGAKVLMVHASPWRPFDEYIVPRSPKLVQFGQLPYDIVILGHTHIPMVHRAGNVLVINPGSCSQPRDQDQRGSYALLDLEQREVEIRRVVLS